MTEASRPEPRIEDFLDHPTRDLGAWQWLWAGDHEFPVRSHRGVLGKLLVFWKRLMRPLVKSPQNDLWDRQRVFNQILLERIQEMFWYFPYLERVPHQLDRVEQAATSAEWSVGVVTEGLQEVIRQHDALYARVDAKLDSYRADAREVLAWARSSLLAAATTDERGVVSARAEAVADAAPALEVAPVADLQRAFVERGYVEFERRFRGTEEEILERLSAYLPYLEGKGPLLDLGCGRGESLRVFGQAGIESRGVDSSGEMVALCRAQDLDATEGDLLEHLAGVTPGSLGAVVSFHVIEHLPPVVIARTVALAWRALRPGGVLILETPNPMSVMVAARSFWLDPTHVRPVHPDFLREVARQHGFGRTDVLPLRPFKADDRLPEIPLGEVPPELRPLADRINRMRDRLDDVLFGYQDYGLVARKLEGG